MSDSTKNTWRSLYDVCDEMMRRMVRRGYTRTPVAVTIVEVADDCVPYAILINYDDTTFIIQDEANYIDSARAFAFDIAKLDDIGVVVDATTNPPNVHLVGGSK